MEKKLKVEEIYECIALLQGVSMQNQETKETKITVLGFCNEKGISEGMRRIANKTLKKVKENYPEEQLKGIYQIGMEELYNDKLPEGYKENGEDNAKLASLKQAKLKELVENEVVIEFEELPDFKVLDSRLEERKESLSYNYTYLFEKLFENY